MIPKILVTTLFALVASTSASPDVCTTGGAGLCYVTLALKRLPGLDAAACCKACTR